ncbi:hypothetical protein [Nocardia barduliensis]|nr:hypothetical protein [Nocardia barduliensis]
MAFFRRGRVEFEVTLHQLSGVGVEGQPISLRTGSRISSYN